ncbi:dienelactone hydrolase family protein [Sinomicrobium weinanense]|uniref:Dienelactone hydrolase family protein n=1 Tax=Sinomicrobium weinanense TaxID=2842200 RepID=A0A926Q2P0_9FLAO|nr:dienelactone hydrolase family protein [Sinomicrobium weinanense]MBC9794875.1 dienelactone hydrolase family protein [Sinomicrobium weinanense]MBU3125646.1 dienelactone hydrolase family protein [Sinomicrobium weinanense]
MKTSIKHLALLLLALIVGSCKNTKKTDPSGTEEPKAVETVDIKREEINYKADTTNLKGYVAYDAGTDKKRPGILIVHEWWGHNDFVRKRADMLAKLGYTALALDMYGQGKQAHHPEDAGKFVQKVMSDMDVASGRFEAANKILKNHPTVDSTKIAAIGYCFGGSVVLVMANMGMDLDAVAVFHGGLMPPQPTKNIKGRLLLCNGEDDPYISKETVSAFKKKMDSVGADYKYISYPGAVHAFTNKTADSLGKKFDLPLAYNKNADEQSWQELQTLLTETFAD